MTLPDLIDRLQKAEGPSRELDAHIKCLLLPEGSYVSQSRFNGAWCCYLTKARDRERLAEARDAKVSASVWASAVTASIDAAIAFKDRVLPETAIDHIGADAVSSPNGYKAIGWNVELINGKRFQGQHQHMAIALVIAVLRALAEHEEAGR